jgi:hypothetical protein
MKTYLFLAFCFAAAFVFSDACVAAVTVAEESAPNGIAFEEAVPQTPVPYSAFSQYQGYQPQPAPFGSRLRQRIYERRAAQGNVPPYGYLQPAPYGVPQQSPPQAVANVAPGQGISAPYGGYPYGGQPQVTYRPTPVKNFFALVRAPRPYIGYDPYAPLPYGQTPYAPAPHAPQY